MQNFDTDAFNQAMDHRFWFLTFLCVWINFVPFSFLFFFFSFLFYMLNNKLCDRLQYYLFVMVCVACQGS